MRFDRSGRRSVCSGFLGGFYLLFCGRYGQCVLWFGLEMRLSSLGWGRGMVRVRGVGPRSYAWEAHIIAVIRYPLELPLAIYYSERRCMDKRQFIDLVGRDLRDRRDCFWRIFSF